jgi:two-component system, chemotaxis family, sensor kinase CheA
MTDADNSDSLDLNVLREMFKGEAYELASELEHSLLALEQSPRDKELIGRVFRALHTLKGSGGACGFSELAHFAHEIEAVYDAVRNDKIEVTKEIIDASLSARDQISALLDEQYGQGQAARDVTDQLINQLRLLLPSGGLPEKKRQVPPAVNAEASDRQTTFRIYFRPARNIFMTGTDPARLIDELRTFGSSHVVAQLDDIPRLETMDPELCYLAWDVVLTTDRGLDAIQDVFLFVQDAGEVSINAVDLVGIMSGEEEQKRLGEILVDRGDVAPEEVSTVASQQKRIGEILIEKGLIGNDRVQAALTEQQHIRELHREHQKTEALSSIRVASPKLDMLVDLVGELVTVQARLSQTAAAGNSALLLSIAEEVERLTAELRDASMSMRMLPIGTIFSKFRRLVRDLTQSLGKSAELTLEGEDTELDKSVIERLHDPLVHIIRNCIDHGIEQPDARLAAGKPRQGTILLSAEHAGAHVLIRIRDDGGGMNTEAIRRKAVAQGLISADAALADQELFTLVLLPGFSTADKVTDVSGRGVGMDVVKQTIDALRGTIEISSSRGQGTTITLALPLTLAIIDGFLTRIGPDHFVFPLPLVDECVELSGAQAAMPGRKSLLTVRGELVPFIRLRERFGIDGGKPSVEQVVITKGEGARVGFVVDHIVGGHQTVVKNLGRMYTGVEGISGATILGDGSVALILDVPKLIQSAEREEASFDQLPLR